MGRSSSKLRYEKSIDYKHLSKTTQFPSKQLKAWNTEFLKDCPRGEMTKEIFMENFRDFFFPNDVNVKRLADYVFNRFDTNKDGVITFEEFIAALSVSSKGTIDEKLDCKYSMIYNDINGIKTGAFSIYDIDDDGYITKDEMLNIVSAIYERKRIPIEECNAAQRKVEQIFIKMDTNCDGKLSRSEFVDGFKNDPQILRSLLDKRYEDT